MLLRKNVVVTSAGVITAVLIAASCASGQNDSDTDTGTEDTAFDSSAELSGELDIMGFGAGDEIATARMERAEGELGDVEVQLIEGELDVQQFLSAVASSSPPEVINANRDQIGTFASRGAIIPLTECIQGEGIVVDDFDEAAIAQVTFDDEVYAIPEFNSVQLTMANGDLLDAAGLTIDDVNGSDWEAVTAANDALTVTEDGRLEVIGYDPKLPEFFPLWTRSNGVDLISEDGRTAQLDDPAVIEALEWAVAMYDAQGGWGTVKAVRDSADFFGSGNQFASGTLGAMGMEQWYVNVLSDVSPDAPMLFDTIRDQEATPIAYATGSAWAIPANTDNPAAACRWARAMTEVDAWLAAADARIEIRQEEGQPFTGLLTANVTADTAVRELVEPTGSEVWDSAVDAMYEANENTFSYPANPADAQFRQAWQDAVNQVLNGQAEPADALAQAQEEAQAALDDAWADWDESDG